MIQEYFDTFNTLHHPIKSIRGGVGNIMTAQAVAGNTLSSKQAVLVNASNSAASDDLLLCSGASSGSAQETAHLFYNTHKPSQQSQQQTLVSAFKPFTRTTVSNESSQLGGQHQYDRMNHHSISKMAAAAAAVVDQNESTGQYAHTYESLDTLEMPSNRRMIQGGGAPAIVHLGINSRNYRTLLAHQPQHQHAHFDMITNNNNSSLSPNTSNTTNMTELGNFNLSSSSSSSSSCTGSDSSTAKFLKSGPATAAMVNLQSLNQAQLIQLLSHQQLNQQFACVPIVNGDGTTTAILQGTWSPDSAYYSTIPANLLAGGGYSLAIQQQANGNMNHHLNQQQQQHFLVNSSSATNAMLFNPTNNDQFKSHLV